LGQGAIMGYGILGILCGKHYHITPGARERLVCQLLTRKINAYYLASLLLCHILRATRF